MDQNETAPEAPATETTAPAEAEAAPWGEDFDPARAWKTIQTQRESEAELKKKLADYQKREKEAEDAKKSEAEKLAEALESAKADAVAARRELAVSRAILKHSLPEGFEEFLTATDPEAIEKQAEKLAEKLAAAKPAVSDPVVPGRPKPNLVPGQGGPDVETVDPDAIAAKVIAAKRY